MIGLDKIQHRSGGVSLWVIPCQINEYFASPHICRQWTVPFVLECLYVEAKGGRDCVDVFAVIFLQYRRLACVVQSTWPSELRKIAMTKNALTRHHSLLNNATSVRDHHDNSSSTKND